ncbi:MAG: sulfurtransferase [Gemmatimonadota bacterium]|nr:sulfurtransferase [Gemmatimonadota bacterium]
MSYTTLISTDDLAAHLDGSAYLVVDCRFKLEDTGSGRRAYEAAHIPGAVYTHLNDDLAGVPNGTNGRHPLPDATAFALTLGRLGIGNGTQVIAYDQDAGMYASRLWWMLRWIGHAKAAVLDGGFAKWSAEGRPTASGVERRLARSFGGKPRSEMIVSATDIGTDTDLLDARAPERFRGDVEPLDHVAGHIPGARNHFYKSNLSADGTFLSATALREQFTRVLGDGSAEGLVSYCGSGVSACHNLLALEHAGLQGARLYPGSWSEWSSDPARGVARSAE